MSADDHADLGHLSLDVSANLAEFKKNIREGKIVTEGMHESLDALEGVAKSVEVALGHVKMTPGQASQSRVAADGIKEGVRGVSEESRTAAREIGKVRITDRQASESGAEGERIKHNVKDIGDEADRTKRKLLEAKLAAGGGGGGSSIGGTSIGLLGAAIGGGTLLAPAAGPGVLGLLAAIPVLAGVGAGAVGTLALAFDGVGKAVKGDKKAFDALGPSAQQFVLTIRSLDGWFDKLRETAASNLFPGLTAGLKAALSPGTVGAITQAIKEFAQAIGQAGEQWGKYFGSAEFQSIFGPLMKAGAAQLKTMSGAALSLFDAIGVLARAAIPFTTWLVNSAAAGSRWVDTFLHAKSATGQLSGAMGEAQTSLRLVGALLGSLLRAVGALGAALYPVSKVAVKDLTDGLNALAGIIERNQAGIREIVGSALAALVSMIKTAVPIVKVFAGLLSTAAREVGGWKVAFEIILTGLLVSKLSALIGPLTKVGGFVSGIGGSAVTAEAEVSALRLSLLGLGAIAIAPIIIPILIQVEKKVKNDLGPLGGIYDNAVGFFSGGVVGNDPVSSALQWAFKGGLVPGGGGPTANNGGTVPRYTGGAPSAAATPSAMIAGRAKMLAFAKDALGKPYLWGGSGPSSFDCSGLVMWAFANGMNISLPHSTYDQATMGVQVDAGNAKVGDVVFTNYGENGLAGPGHEGLIVGYKNGQPIIEAAPHKGARVHTYTGYDAFTGGGNFTVRDLSVSASADMSPFGADPAWTTNTGQLTAKQKASAARRALAARLQIPVTNDQALVAHFKSLAASATSGSSIVKYLDDEAKALKKENVDLEKSLQGKTDLQKARIHKQMQANLDSIAKIHAQVSQALAMTTDAAAFKQFQSKLSTLSAKFKSDSHWESALTGFAAAAYEKTIQGDLVAERVALTDEVASLKSKIGSTSGKRKKQLQTELATVQTKLADVNQQILSSLEGTVQTLQSKVSSLFGRVTSQLDAAFEAKTQEMVDALGVQFFQNGAQTPIEQQLAAMQGQDQLQSLQDAITQATDAKSKAAAQRQLDEYNLSIAAQKERTQADRDYAAAVKKLQADRSRLETAMNSQLAILSDGFANGTGSMDQLTAIATQYGIQIDTETIPDFNDLSAASTGLVKSFRDLADYISKITGVAPTMPQPTSHGYVDLISLGLGRFGSVAPPTLQRIPPSLDIGGTVLTTGLAMVHRGETFSGVGGRPARDIVLQVGERELARAAADGLDNASGRVVLRKLAPLR